MIIGVIIHLFIICYGCWCHFHLKQERLKRRNTLGCLDQYAAQNSKYARPPIPSQPPTQKVFFQWHTQYDPTMKHSHCETVYAKELFQWLSFELVDSLWILSILPTYKLAGLTKECQWQGCTKWRTRRTSPPQADFDRAKKWFQNQAEQTSSPARLINKWNKTYLIILNMNYNPYL